MGGGDKPQTHPSGWARALEHNASCGNSRENSASADEPARDGRVQDQCQPRLQRPTHTGRRWEQGHRCVTATRGLRQSNRRTTAEGTPLRGRRLRQSRTRHVQLAEHTRGLKGVIQLALQLNHRKGVREATGEHTETQVRPRSWTQTWGWRERGRGAWVVSTVRGRAWRGTSLTHTHTARPQGSAESKASSLNSSNDLSHSAHGSRDLPPRRTPDTAPVLDIGAPCCLPRCLRHHSPHTTGTFSQPHPPASRAPLAGHGHPLSRHHPGPKLPHPSPGPASSPHPLWPPESDVSPPPLITPLRAPWLLGLRQMGGAPLTRRTPECPEAHLDPLSHLASASSPVACTVNPLPLDRLPGPPSQKQTDHTCQRQTTSVHWFS